MQIHQTYRNIFEVSEGPIFIGKVWQAEAGSLWCWALCGMPHPEAMESDDSNLLNAVSSLDLRKDMILGFIANKASKRMQSA